MNNSSKLQLKLILPWTNHIYIEYDITVKWPPSIKKKTEPIVIEEKPELVEPSTSTTQPPPPIQLDSLNIYYTVSVKGTTIVVNYYYLLIIIYIYSLIRL